MDIKEFIRTVTVKIIALPTLLIKPKMTTVFLSNHFILKEFVPQEIYNVFGDNSRWFINPKIIAICEHLRVKLDRPITINNWHLSGQYNYSGYRPPDYTTGAKFSQHKLGQAADIKVTGMDAGIVRNYIRDNFKELNALGLTTIEKGTPSWCHLDCRWTNSDKLLEVPYQ